MTEGNSDSQDGPKIRFNEPTGFGALGASESMSGEESGSSDDGGGDGPQPVMRAGVSAAGAKKIRAIEKLGVHEDKWNRQPNVTGSGAIHVRTFHSKINNDSLGFMDQTINEWLDSHPEYEVKFVSTTVGEFTGKMKEPAVICQVWV